MTVLYNGYRERFRRFNVNRFCSNKYFSSNKFSEVLITAVEEAMELKDVCVFCKIEPADRIICSEDLFVSLLSDPRLKKGHVLVVPRRHVEVPTDLSNNELAAIYSEIKRLQKRLLNAFAEGCDVWQKYQPFVPEGGIKVNHIHFHVLPRDFEDGLFISPEEGQLNLFKPLDESERRELVSLLA